MSEAKEIVELTFDKLEQYFNAAQRVIEQYGGEAVELGLMALRIEAGSELVRPLVFLILCGFMIYKLLPTCFPKIITITPEYINDLKDAGYEGRTLDESNLFKNYKYIKEDFEIPDDLEQAKYLVPIIINVLLIATVIISISKLINIWAWAGIFYPELYAVHKFIL